MRLLDLFCGEGGAAIGYARAGFEVVGVDIKRQHRYPFELYQGDALTWPLDGFDVIHASPPCQAYSITRHAHHVQHPDLIAPTRERLKASGLPYVIENVPGAPLLNPVTVCGAAMGCTYERMVLRRHRLFESNVALLVPPCACSANRAKGYRIAGVYGGGSRDERHAREVRKGGWTPDKEAQAALIGVDHMTLHGLAQSIPPAYTEHIGTQLMAHLGVNA